MQCDVVTLDLGSARMFSPAIFEIYLSYYKGIRILQMIIALY